LPLRARLPRLMPPLASILLLVTLIGPAERAPIGFMSGLEGEEGDRNLPIVVHLILDGHIGVEGIPADIDKDGSEARRLRDLYVDRGFRLFGRAYTHNSIPAVLNFNATKVLQDYVRHNGPDWILTQNRYFELMSQRGYAIRVFQSTYLDYCVDDDGNNIVSCWTFDPEHLKTIQGTPMSLRQKVQTIFGVYARLSSLAIHIDVPTTQLTPIASLPVLENLEKEIVAAPRGTLFFAHLLLPHSPYGLLADCQVRPQPGSWLMSHDKNLTRRRNNSATRLLRYPAYLAQLQCTCSRIEAFLDAVLASPQAQDMVLVIHGDHGSRLDRGPVEMNFIRDLEDSDFIDAFSTLFAVRRAGIEPGYDRRMLPLDWLFDASVRDGHIPAGDSLASEPGVLLEQAGKLRPYPMPEFGRSLGQLASP
jgi:hypothetical protein